MHGQGAKRMDARQLSWFSGLKRWRWALVAIGVGVAIRVALPFALRYVLISQGSEKLRAQVEVGDVDLWVLRGAVAIEDFALRPLPDAGRGKGSSRDSGSALQAIAPSVGGRVEGETIPSDSPVTVSPAAPGEPSTEAPLVAWKRLLADIHWLPLWRKTIQLGAVELESPSIALDRLRSGNWSFEPVLRAAMKSAEGETGESDVPLQTPAEAESEENTSAPTAPEPSAADSGWQIGADRVVLRHGRVRFRDLFLKGSEPVDVTLPAIEVKDLALSPGLYGEPAHALVNLGVDQGSLTLDVRFKLIDEGIFLDAKMQAQRLPVRRGRLYIPGVGWSDLRGELDLDAGYTNETGVRDELKGTITLRDVAVTVPGLEGTALAWKRFSVRLDPLDLLASQATVAELDVQGLETVVRLLGEDRLPVLRRLMEGSETGSQDSVGEDTERAERAPTKAAPKEKPPWKWSVSQARVTNSVVHVLAESPFDVGVQINLENVTGEGVAPATVDVVLRSEVGTIDVKGSARVQPVGFGGSVKLQEIDVPVLVEASGALPPKILQTSALNADIIVEAGMAAPGSVLAPGAGDVCVRGLVGLADSRLSLAGEQGAAVSLQGLDIDITGLDIPAVLVRATAASRPQSGQFRFRGKLHLDKLQVASADGKEFSFGAQAVDVGVTELAAAGGLSAGEAAGAKNQVHIALDNLSVNTPAIRITRRSTGIVMPAFSITSSEPDIGGTTSEKPSPIPEAARTESPPQVDLVVSSVQITNGRLDVIDHSVKPTFSGKLAPILLKARDVRWPDVAAKQLRLEVTTPAQGRLEVTGDMSPRGGTLQLNGQDVSLPPYNSYAGTYSPYRVLQGTLSLATKVTFDGRRYDTTNALKLHQLYIEGGGGESPLQKEFGIPVSMAIALMKDTNDDIRLDIPVQVDPKGVELHLLAIVGQALRKAIVNALASPLKVFGAITGGDEVSLVPPTIALKPGRAEPTDEGSERVKQLGKLLANRPGMGVEIETAITTQDTRWLHEQALRHQWQEQGFFGAVRAMAQGEVRENVERALAARAEDQPGELSDEAAAALEEWLKDAPPPTAQELQALAAQRLALIATTLRERAGIDPTRIQHGEPGSEIIDEAPVVRMQLQPLPNESGRD